MRIEQYKGIINSSGAPNEKACLFTHRLHKNDGSKRAVLVLAGHNGDARTSLAMPQFLGSVGTVLSDIGAALALALPILTIDAGGGTLFGNDTAISRAVEAIDWIVSQGIGKAGVILAGTSMGSILAVNVAARYPVKVAALALFYPAMDLQYTHDNGNAAEVEAAYGGLAAFNAAVASHRGIDQAAAGALGSTPIKGWYATPDNVVGPNAWSQFKTALASGGSPAPGDYDLGNVGHGDNTLPPLSDVQTFYAAHA